MQRTTKTSRLLAILLTVVLMLTMIPVTVFAAEDPPTLLAAAVTGTGHVELTFDKAMAAPGGGAAGFTVTGSFGLNKNVQSVTLYEGDPTKILLTLLTTIKGGEDPMVSYSAETGTMESADGGYLADVSRTITNGLPHPTLEAGAPPAGAVGTAYTHTFSAAGGASPYLFYKHYGNLPPGLILDNSGVLSGTPSASGSFTFRVRTVDANEAIGLHEFTIAIAAGAGVCEIGGTPYPTLVSALAAATTGQTITLLQDVTETNPVIIDGKSITFNLNNEYDLTLDTSGTINSIALLVENGGSVGLIGTGALNVIGGLSGVRADGASSTATVTNATAVGINSHAADAFNGGNVLVLNNATANGASSNATFAYSGGTITVNGNAESSWHCAYANMLGSSVHIKGSATALMTLDNSAGARAGSNAEVRVDQNVSGVAYGAHADGGGKIIAGSNVTASASNGIGAFAEGSSQITVNGTITGTEYIKTGSTTKTSSDKTSPTTKPGYYTYNEGSDTVWVKSNDSAAIMPPSRIAAGSGFSLSLKEDGMVWAWGGNVYGQLGRGSFTDYSFDVPAQVQEISDVKSIAAGQLFSLALKEDGTVWAWGTNGNGQLGQPPAALSRSHTPVQVAGLSDIQAISAGYRFGLALDDNGDVWAWGNNTKGQLGQVAAETIHTPGKISGLSNVVAISAGYMHSLALDADGNVWAWGSNFFGELGNGTVEPTSTNPVPAKITLPEGLTVASICAAFQNSMLTTDTGAVYGWGENSEGALGDGTESNRVLPTLTSYSEISALGGTGAFYIALKNDGTVMGTGENDFGSDIIHYGWTPVLIDGLAGIAAISQGNGGNHALALDSSGDVWAWGSNSSEACGQNTDFNGQPKKIVPPAKVQFPGSDISAATVSMDVPATGGIPQTAAQVQSATNHADYTVTGLIWNEALTGTGKFKPGQVYTATVTLTSKNSKKFQSAAFTPTVAGSASVSQTITTGSSTGNTVSFTVTYGQTAAATYSIAAITNQTMTELTAGYAAGTQQIKTITVTKTGTGDLINLAVALSGAGAESFTVTQPAITSLDEPTPSTAFTVKAKDGLSAGIYTATITVSADNMIPAAFSITQVVNSPVAVSASILPTSEWFNKNVFTADVNTTITWNDASTVTDVKKNGTSIGASAYTVNGSTLKILKEYLSSQPAGNLVLTIEFDTGNAAEFTIMVVDERPVAEGSAVPQTVTAGITGPGNGTVTFSHNASYHTYPEHRHIVEYQWIFDVMNPSNPNFNAIDWGGIAPGHYSADGKAWHSTDPNAKPTYTYMTAGNYLAALRVIDNATPAITGIKLFNITVNASNDNDGGGGGGDTPPSSGQARVTGGPSSITSLAVNVDSPGGSAGISLTGSTADTLFGEGNTTIHVPSITGVSSYTLDMPASALTGGQNGALTFATELGRITISDSMLAGIAGNGGEDAAITIGEGDRSVLPEAVMEAIGNRPLIQLTLTMDGKRTEWNNPEAPVTVTIPYTPNAEELQDPEHIVIWYLDGSGNVVSVPSGRFDPVTGAVTFSTTHFSDYAVAYVHKTFADLNGTKWAKKAIEVMASKGIINGTGKDSCSPKSCITRADYMVMLVKSLGLTADFKDNFADAKPGVYYYESLGIAKKLGIATGSGDNQFRPKEKISRQDMMVLAARALEKVKKLETSVNSGVLDQYSDKDRIAGYASECLAALIQNELIAGSGNKLNPRGDTTRAEAAVFLYRIYNQ